MLIIKPGLYVGGIRLTEKILKDTTGANTGHKPKNRHNPTNANRSPHNKYGADIHDSIEVIDHTQSDFH